MELILDDEGRTTDWLYLEHNPALARLTGISQNIVGKKASDIYQNLEPFWMETFDRVVREGASERFEYSIAELGNRWFDVYAARVGGAGSRQLVIVYNNITERKRREQLQQYLLKLGDALRPVASPMDIEGVVTHLALEHFAADRCYYCTIEDGNAIARKDAVRGDLPSVAGIYPLHEFAIFRSAIEAGKPYAVPNVRTTDKLDEGLRQICLQLDIVSYINVPVIKQGAAVGIFCLVQSTPREWTTMEIDLAAETAERTWAAIERTRAEAALRESESRLQTVLQALPVGVWITDVNGRIIGKNKQSDKIWAGDAPLVKGVDQYDQYQSWDAISGKELETEDFPLTRTLRTGKPVEAEEHRIRRLDRSTGFVLVSAVPIKDDEGRLTGAVAINLDVTDRKRAAEERERLLASISEYSEKLTTIVGSITDEVWFADANGMLTLLNPQARTNLGLDFNTGDSVDDVVNALEILNPDGTLRSREDTPLLKSLKGEKITGEEIIRHRRTGELMYRMFSSIPVRDTKGDIIGAVATSTDITERKRREANLAFLAEVSQDLSGLTNIEETMNAIGEKIGTYFRLSHCIFVERDEGGETSTINYGWHRSDVPEVRGIYRVRDFLEAEFAERSMRGEVIVVGDTASDPLTDTEQFAKLGIGSFVTVPLLRAGELRFWIGIYDSVPRDWRDDEIELLREITTRIWTRLERARAEAALQESEEKYRTLFENMTEMFQILEPIFSEDGKVRDFRYIKVNRATELLAGKSREEIEGKTALEVWEYVEDYWFEMLGRALKSNKPVHMIDYSRTLDLYYDVNAWKANEHNVAIVFSNITERMRAEEALAKSEEKYRTLFNSIDEGFCIIEVLFDEMEKPIDYRFLEINPSFEQQTGIEHAVGRRMRDIAPEHEEHWFEIYGRVALTGEPERFTNRAKQLHRWYDVYAFRVDEPQLRRVAILFNDITASKQAEETLRVSEEKYRTLFEEMDQGFCILQVIFDDHDQPIDLRYIETNPVFERESGLKNAEGKAIQEMVSYIEPFWIDFYGQVTHTGKPAHAENYAQSWGQWFKVDAYPIGDPNQHLVAVLFSNVTERKRAEEALRESEARYHLLFENTQAAVHLLRLVLDEQGQVTDLIYIDGNQADRATLNKLTGKTFEEIVGKRYSELWPADFVTQTIELMKRLKANSGTLAEEVYSPLSNTYHLTRLIELAPDLVLVTTVTLTKRKHTEKAPRKRRK